MKHFMMIECDRKAHRNVWFNKSTTMFVVLLVVAVNQLASVDAGCRNQEHHACETVCRLNRTTQQHECSLRAIVILPKTTKVEASLPRVSVKLWMSALW